MVKSSLHNDGPDIHADIKNSDGVEADLGSAALTQVFHVEDKPKAKAADAGERCRVSNVNIDRRERMLDLHAEEGGD